MGKTVGVPLAVAVIVVAVSWLVPAAGAGPPGSLDPTFSGDGKATFPIGSDQDLIFDAVKQPDGRIVLAGSFFDGNDYQVAVMRVDDKGNLDPTFGGDGIVELDFGNGDDTGLSAALQDDGKIVITGQVWTGSEFDVLVIRLNPDGTLDPTFDGDGEVFTDIDDEDEGTGVAVDKSGDIVVVGETFMTPDDSAFFLARYKPNGAPDTSVNGTGVRVTNFGSGSDGARDVALLPDGRIVSVGTADFPTGINSAFVFYNANGTVAQTSTVDFGGDDTFNSVVISDPSHWAAVGTRSNGSNSDLFVAKFVVTGTLDPAFGTGGFTGTDGFGFDDFGNDLVVDPTTGDMYAFGSARSGASSATSDFFLARYGPNGVLDPSFGTGGKAFADFFGGQDSGVAGLLVGDKVYAAGPVGSSQVNFDFGLARFFTANRPPTAAVASFPSTVSTGTSVTFDGLPSSDPDGDTLTYQWFFDDLIAAISGSKVQHTFVTAAVHKVALVVRDTAGATNEFDFEVNVTPAERTFSLLLPGSTILGRPFMVGGELSSPFSDCVNRVGVDLLFDPPGGGQKFGVIVSKKTDDEGAFRISAKARKGRYAVRAPATPACAEAKSLPLGLNLVIEPLVFREIFTAPGQTKRHVVAVQGTSAQIRANSGAVDVTGVSFKPGRSTAAAGKLRPSPIKISKTRGKRFVRVRIAGLKPGGKLRFKVVARKISKATRVTTRVTQRI